MTLFRWTEVQLPLLKQGAPTENLPPKPPTEASRRKPAIPARFRCERPSQACNCATPSLRLFGGGWRGLLDFVHVDHFAHERGFGGEFAAYRSAAVNFAE